MWHASVASQVLRAGIRRKLAHKALTGVGLAAKEWEQDRRVAFHLRRRLTPTEEAIVGSVVDLRGTAEGAARLEAIRLELPWPALEMAVDEIR